MPVQCQFVWPPLTVGLIVALALGESYEFWGKKMPRVVTAGETMVLLQSPQPGRLRHARQMDLSIGGAESNVAIALARLGLHVSWVSWVSEDELGQLILDRIRAEGVSVDAVQRLEHPSGLYLRERTPEGIKVYYYRRGSAASHMDEHAFDASLLDGASLLHLTGITPALSCSCRNFTAWAMREAKARGVPVSFDINYRAKLWTTHEARCALEPLLQDIDVLFVSDEEAQALWPDHDVLGFLAQAGPREVILKQGDRGCLARIDGDDYRHEAFAVDAIDAIGAGDAFAAGYIAGRLWGESVERCLKLANALGAYSVMNLGDYEGLPDKASLQHFISGEKALDR